MDAALAIEVRDLTFRYPRSERPALAQVSFSVGRGEIFGLLGPSGAGKSTLQRVLTGQIRRVEQGEVRVLGFELVDFGPELAARIGVGFELPSHFLRLTARENLALFAALYPRAQDPLEVLARVGLEGVADRRVGTFSKGMMMRLNFARALLHDPELLFLDEPTSGLDPVNARRVKEEIRRASERGKTVVLTTHDMTVVEALCGRVGFLVDGEMKTLDRKDALKARHGRREVVIEHGPEAAPRLDRFALEGLATNARFLDLLARADLRALHSQEASLEAVFVAVTGAELVGPDGEEA